MDDVVRRRRLAEGEHLEVFRLVHGSHSADPRLLEDMKSNAAKGRPPRGRETRQPAIHRGISVYKSMAQAIVRRESIVLRLRQLGSSQPIRMGDYVARLVLAGAAFEYEDRDEPDGHMTIWGEPLGLLGAIAEISPAEPEE